MAPDAPDRGDRTIAVALEADGDCVRPPKITASGKGELAEQLIAIALANGVKLREDADLAQILTAFDVDSTIPLEALDAVAEILAYVYRANGEIFDPEGTISREWGNLLAIDEGTAGNGLSGRPEKLANPEPEA